MTLHHKQRGDFAIRTSSVGTGMFASCYLHQAATWQPLSRPNKGVVYFSYWLCATYAVTTKRGSQKPIRPAQRQQLMQRTWPERAMTSDGSAQHRMSRYWWLRNTGVSRYDWRRAIPGNQRLCSHTARLISVIIMKAKAVNTEKYPSASKVQHFHAQKLHRSVHLRSTRPMNTWRTCVRARSWPRT